MTTSSPVAGDVPHSGSASSIVAGAVSGYHLLKIVGYSRTKEVPHCKWIDSCPFWVGGCTWHVRYYPNGCVSEDIDYISTFLTLDDTLAEAETVKAQFKFSLLDQDGKPVPSCTQTTTINDFSVNKSWGFPNFITREALEKSEHLKDDSFTVRVDVTIMSNFHTQDTPSILLPPSNMHRHFADLLSSKMGVDVEFRVGGKTFSAHRSVLAARSPVFRAQFYGPMKEGTTTEAICIDDMDAQVFDALLSFIYTDALPEMKQEEKYSMAQHLLVAADRYDFDRLKLICQDKLTRGMDTGSVATILVLADQHHCNELKAARLEFLSSPTNLEESIKAEGFELLTKTCPGVIKDFLKSQVIPSLLGKRKSRA